MAGKQLYKNGKTLKNEIIIHGTVRIPGRSIRGFEYPQFEVPSSHQCAFLIPPSGSADSCQRSASCSCDKGFQAIIEDCGGSIGYIIDSVAVSQKGQGKSLNIHIYGFHLQMAGISIPYVHVVSA